MMGSGDYDVVFDYFCCVFILDLMNCVLMENSFVVMVVDGDFVFVGVIVESVIEIG